MNIERIDSDTVKDHDPTSGSTEGATQGSTILAAMSGTANNKDQEDTSTPSDANNIYDSSTVENADDDIESKLIKHDEVAEFTSGRDINKNIEKIY